MGNMRILFAGDFCPINRVERLAFEGRAHVVFGDVLTELQNKDLSVLNLECPLTKSNSPIPKNGPNHKADPKAVECIKAGGFDIVNLANNHIADYGSPAVGETIFLLESNKIEHVGAGSSLSTASKPLRVQCRNKVIAFLAFAEQEFNWADEKNAGAWPLDPLLNISQIRKAKTESDFVVVMVHGGNEYNPIPSPRIVETYRAFVDAGATAVIGTHPHVPQGYEVYKGAPIFYSLGNFVFDSEKKHGKEPLWAKSYTVRLNFQENSVKDIEIVPYKALAETGCLTLLKDEELSEFVRYTDFLSRVLKDDNEINKYWNAWCTLMGPKWLHRLSLCSPFALTYTMLRSKHFSAMKCFLAAKNLITSESHSEILNTYMDLIVKNQVEPSKDYIPIIKTLQKGKIPRQSQYAR